MNAERANPHSFHLNFITPESAVAICSTCGWFSEQMHPAFAQVAAEEHLGEVG